MAFSRREMVLLSSSCESFSFPTPRNKISQINKTYLSTVNGKINLTTVSTHESTELLANSLQNTQPVVLGQGGQEVLQDVTLVSTSDLLELLDDGLLVVGGEGRGADDGGELAVSLQGLTKGSEGLGGLVKSSRLGGSSVLLSSNLSVHCSFSLFGSFNCQVFLWRSRINGDRRRPRQDKGDPSSGPERVK